MKTPADWGEVRNLADVLKLVLFVLQYVLWMLFMGDA